MALPARMEEAQTTSGTAREPRRKITLEVSGALASEPLADVTIHNISATGMLIEYQRSLAIDEILAIDLPNAEATQARIVWSSGALHGCQFLEPLSKAVLSAAQLISAVSQSVDTSAPGPADAGEPFSVRFQRLRKQRGLSLARIATELEVSKPTVWAWEQGRARPVPDRIELLARVLGTSIDALQTGRDGDALSGILEKSKRQIADAYRISPDNVRIMIEL